MGESIGLVSHELVINVKMKFSMNVMDICEEKQNSFHSQIHDSKPDMKTVVKMAKQAFGPDSPKIEIARKMTTTCAATVTATERCEAAAQMYACSVEEAKKYGYEFSDFM